MSPLDRFRSFVDNQPYSAKDIGADFVLEMLEEFLQSENAVRELGNAAADNWAMFELMKEDKSLDLEFGAEFKKFVEKVMTYDKFFRKVINGQ